MNNPIDRINADLGIQAGVTFKGDELKCWTPDNEDGGVSKTYLSADDCDALALAFAAVAEMLRKAPA